jgi:hypothetical protein
MNLKLNKSVKLLIFLSFLVISISPSISIVVAAKNPIMAFSSPILANHTIINQVRLDLINETAVQYAKDNLHVAYFHTSHGSQLTANRLEMIAFKGQLYNWTEGGQGDSLDLDDYCFSGDLGNPDRVTWESRARTYLDNNPDVNVLMGSWCGQVSSASQEDINTYTSLMSGLENDYPNVTFVYMTGHVDGTGLSGNLHLRNEDIREFCVLNNKVLFDFADIESYDPDGNYFGDKNVQDDCDYNGGNWAIEWQNNHTEGVDWFSCSSAHSQPLNANMKTYAMWWMFTMIAQGGVNDPQDPPGPEGENLWLYIGLGIGATAIITGLSIGFLVKKKRD